MTDALSNYAKFVLAHQPTTKGKAKGSKRSAPGKDAPLPSAEKLEEDPKTPKILKRTLIFMGPALLCTDAIQENSFPFASLRTSVNTWKTGPITNFAFQILASEQTLF